MVCLLDHHEVEKSIWFLYNEAPAQFRRVTHELLTENAHYHDQDLDHDQ